MSNKKDLPVEQTSAEKGKVDKAQAPKQSFMERVKAFGKRWAKWGRELKSELKKIVWPTKNQVIKNTGVVLLVCAVMTLSIWIMDLIFENLILNGLLKLITGF